MRLSFCGLNRVDLGHAVAEGTTPGCGCCSSRDPLNDEDLKSFREELTDMVEFIDALLSEIATSV